MNNALEPHIISSEVAPKILDWLSRGPVALYRSVNLSNPGGLWLVPTGNGKPNWQSAEKPERLLTASEIVVVRDVEVRRFRVGIRRAQFSFKVTDGGSRRIRSAVAKAGPGAFHVFDYETQQAVIMKPDGAAVPLTTWMEAR